MSGTDLGITSRVYTTTDVADGDIEYGHSWEADGHLYATVRFSSKASITLGSSATAQALIDAVTRARDALAKLEASASPATPEERASYEAWRASRAAGQAAPAEGGSRACDRCHGPMFRDADDGTCGACKLSGLADELTLRDADGGEAS